MLRGERALLLHQLQEAQEILQRVPRELLDAGSADDRCRLLCLHAVVLESLAQPGGDQYLQRAIAEAQVAADRGARARCLAWKARLVLARGHLEEARQDLDAAVIAAGLGSRPLQEARARVAVGGALVRLGLGAEAHAELTRAEELAPGVPVVALAARQARGELALLRGDLAAGGEILTGVAEEAGRRRLLSLQGACLLVLGDLRGARGELEGARQAYARLGNLVGPLPSRLLFLSWLRRGGLAVEHAELEEAAQALAQAVEVARELQDPWSRAMTFIQGGEIEARRGRLALAASIQRQAVPLLEELQDRVGLVEVHRRRAEVLFEMGDLAGAETAFAQALTAAATPRLGGLRLRLLLARGSFYERRGDFPAALADYRMAIRELRHAGSREAAWPAWLAAASLQGERLRRPRRGQRILEMILQRADEAGYSLVAAEARLRLAASCITTGEVERAHALLHENATFFEGLGDRRRQAESVLRLGDLFLYGLGDQEEGHRHYQLACKILEDAGDRMGLALVTREIGSRCAQQLAGGYNPELFSLAEGYLLRSRGLFESLEVCLPQVDLHFDLGELHLQRREEGGLRQALSSFEEGRRLAARAGHAAGLARYQAARARLAAAREMYREALLHYEAARDQYEELGDLAGVYRVEFARGEIQLSAGERSRAELSLKRALAVAERMGSLWDQRTTYYMLHHLKAQLGDHPAAARMAAASRALEDIETIRRRAQGKLSLYERLDSSRGIQGALLDLVRVELEAEQPEAAQEATTRLEALTHEDASGAALLYRQVGDIYLDHGDLAEADTWYFRAFDHTREESGTAAAVSLAESLVSTFDEVQDLGSVDRWAQLAVETSMTAGADRTTLELHARLGAYYQSRERHGEALELLKEGLQCARELQDAAGELEIARALGELHRDLSRFHEAVAWFEIAHRVSETRGDARERRDLALRIASCHALAATATAQGLAPEGEVAALRRQARAWLTEALELDGTLTEEAVTPPEEPPGGQQDRAAGDLLEPRVQTLSAIAEVHLELGDGDTARVQFEEGARQLERHGYPGRQGDYLATVGDRYREHSTWGTAAAWYRRAFYSYLMGGEPERALEVIGDACDVYLEARDPAMAVQVCQEALGRLGAEADADILGRITHMRARLEARGGGDRSVALGSLREAVGYYRSAGNMERVIEAHDDLARIHMEEPSVDAAVACYRELLEMVLARDNPPLVALVYARIGEMYRMGQEYPEALASFERALEVVEQNGGTDYALAEARENLALTHLDAGNLDDALELFSRANDAYHRVEDLREIAWVHLWCCDIHLRQGDVESARRRARRAEVIFRGQREAPALVEAVIWLAQCDEADGNREKALEGLHYALARVKAMHRDEDRPRPLRFLHDLFIELEDPEAAADCAAMLRRLGEEPPPPEDSEDEDDDFDLF